MPYYAVAIGRAPGVYGTWDECQREVHGFTGARFKKFNSRNEAMAFVNDQSFPPSSGSPSSSNFEGARNTRRGNFLCARAIQNLTALSGSSNDNDMIVDASKKQFYYAVARGTKPGVYNSWADCQAATTGFQYPKFRKFSSMAEARSFMEENRSHSNTSRISNKRHRPMEEPEFKRLAIDVGDVPVVFTDGACSNNGKRGATAGYGVYWGDGHEDNISAPVSGDATNNRAEYEAVFTALQQAQQRGLTALKICTDSKLLINSMDNWLDKWKRNNWTKSDGQAVKNRDLLEAIDGLRDSIDVQFEHVKGHAGIHGNEMADSLAREGARKHGAVRR